MRNQSMLNQEDDKLLRTTLELSVIRHKVL